MIYETVRSRIDTALNRGRCGLWDWDLARGRIFWSHSMFAILGLEPRDELLSFGEVNALVHPDDIDLYELARAARRRQGQRRSTTTSACATPTATGSGCARAASWCSSPASRAAPDRHRGRHHRAEDAGRAHRRRPTCACATPSRPSRKPSCCGTPTTAWCCAIPTSRSCTTCPTTAIDAGTPYEAVVAAGRKPVVRTKVDERGRPVPGARTFEAQLDDGRWLQISERRTKDGGYVSVGTDITALKLHEEEADRERAAADGDGRRPAPVAADARAPGRASSPISPRNTPRRRPAPRRPTRPSRSSSPT